MVVCNWLIDALVILFCYIFCTSGSLVVGEKAKRPLAEDFYLNILNVEDHFTLQDILTEFPRLCHVK